MQKIALPYKYLDAVSKYQGQLVVGAILSGLGAIGLTIVEAITEDTNQVATLLVEVAAEVVENGGDVVENLAK